MRLGVMMAIDTAPGHAVMVLPAREELTDAGGGIHEGALAALVDSAGGAAAWSIDGFDPRGRAATIGMHLCYDRTPAREDVVVEARTSWRAAGIFLNTVMLTARTSGRPVATGSVTYRIVRPDA
jgi:acyl-coenzyme A thioesterase PaaI-like protein